MKDLKRRPRCACHAEPMVKNGGNSWRCAIKRREYAREYTRRRYATPRGRAYESWRAARARCTDPAHRDWSRYGGRGVTMCVRWRRSFAAFYADMGGRPKGRTLDRVNNERGYSPSNCRWATPKQQRANQRRR